MAAAQPNTMATTDTAAATNTANTAAATNAASTAQTATAATTNATAQSSTPAENRFPFIPTRFFAHPTRVSENTKQPARLIIVWTPSYAEVQGRPCLTGYLMTPPSTILYSLTAHTSVCKGVGEIPLQI